MSRLRGQRWSSGAHEQPQTQTSNEALGRAAPPFPILHHQQGNNGSARLNQAPSRRHLYQTTTSRSLSVPERITSGMVEVCEGVWDTNPRTTQSLSRSTRALQSRAQTEGFASSEPRHGSRYPATTKFRSTRFYTKTTERPKTKT